jgi:putative ABC transport system substrate-binding protein
MGLFQVEIQVVPADGGASQTESVLVDTGALYPGPATFPVVAEWIRENEVAATALALKLKVVDIGRDPGNWERAFQAMVQDGIQALSLIESPTFFSLRPRIAGLALKHRLPTIFPFREQVEAGGLMSYGADVVDLYRPPQSL